MRQLRIYLDTSIIGGVFDREFMEPSKKLFEQIKSGHFKAGVSEVVNREIQKSPEKVKLFYKVISPLLEKLPITRECLELREQYLEKGIVSKKYLDDALHVAVATVSNCDIITSWNFKHIVHYEKIYLYNAINKLNGFREIFINTPLKILYVSVQNY